MTYTDAAGNVSSTKIGVMVGDKLLEDPGGEQWATKLKTLMDWVKKGVQEKLNAQKEVTAPKEDKVNILVESKD